MIDAEVLIQSRVEQQNVRAAAQMASSKDASAAAVREKDETKTTKHRAQLPAGRIEGTKYRATWVYPCSPTLHDST